MIAIVRHSGARGAREPRGPRPAPASLVPVFGILWGVLLLDEGVGWHTLVGSVSILVGTALATGFSLHAVLADVRWDR